nr:hypothetical protein [Burkholderia diffusa]
MGWHRGYWGHCVPNGGSVVSPAPVIVAPPIVAPAGVPYIAPVGISPAVGYAWRYHAGIGWSWWHPRHGWWWRR